MTSLPLRWTPIATLLIGCMGFALTANAEKKPLNNDTSLELMFYAGGGKQLHTSHQNNSTYGVDLNVYRYPFSEKQMLSFGASIAQLNSNTDNNKQLIAVSIYPQLNLSLPTLGSTKPFFYVRTLGPTYISEKKLGERQQAYHFVFQSQIGLGAYFGEANQWQANLSYRHYSNANLGQPNDGIDATLLFTLGKKLQ